MREDTSIQEKELIPIRLVQAVGALLLILFLKQEFHWLKPPKL